LQSTPGSLEGFEARGNGTWQYVPASLSATGAVTLDTAGVASVTGVRYAWGNVPRGRFVYDADSLPARPFLAECGARGCTLVAGGHVPEGLSLGAPERDGCIAFCEDVSAGYPSDCRTLCQVQEE